MSHCEAILDVLASGRWVSTSEILRAVPCVVHSRVSDLRARGYEIDHRTTGVGAAGSEYRLVTPAAPVALANEITALIAEGVLEAPGGLVEEAEPSQGGPRPDGWPDAETLVASSTNSLAAGVGANETGQPSRLIPSVHPQGSEQEAASTPAASEPEQLPLEAA